MLKRLVAVLTTLVLAVGLTVGVSTAASASATCDSSGYLKPTSLDSARGDVDFEWGNLTWSGKSLTYTISPGWTVDLCLKASTTVYRNDGRSGTGTITLTGHDISHVGYANPRYTPQTALTCDVATLVAGRPLTNGDHINMDVTRNGGAVFQVNASVDIRQTSDPASESGLVLRIKLDTGNTVLALTNAQVSSGILAFEYSKAWTGTWQIQWVQYNSSYFNQNRDVTKFKNCQRDIVVEIKAVPYAKDPTCSVDGSLVLPAPPTGITWQGGKNGDGPNTYTITAVVAAGYTLNGATDSWVIQVLPKGTNLDCGPPPCIASNQVTYTYDPATNSGTVTVPNPAGSSGKLCNGFWVTAVSWKFKGSGTWPQTLDQNNPMPEKNGSFFVDEPGTYSYGATVTCGQGDIYASYDKQPVPTAELYGPDNPYDEHFLHDMGFKGPTPTYVQNAPGCNKATPVPPTATPITQCGTDGKLVYGPTTGVVYTLTVGNGTTGAWEVTATPAPNYYFAGSQIVKFTGNLGTRTDCVQAAPPTYQPAVCNSTTGVVTGAYVIIPTTTPNVQYRVDGTLYAAGAKVDLGVGDHLVKAEPISAAYTLTGQTEFPITVEKVDVCDDPVEYVAPVVTDEICDEPTGEIKRASIVFTDVEFLTYYLDGTKITFAAGETTKTVTVKAGPHTITVETDDGYYLKGTNLLTEKDYPLTVSTPKQCDDPVKYVAPDVDQETCNTVSGGVSKGVVTFDLADLEHLTYVFDGTTVDKDHLVFPRAAGDYTLVVTAQDGYYISGGGKTATYTIPVPGPGKVCDSTTTIPTDPYPKHEECVPGDVNGATYPGAIIIVKADHVTWQIVTDKTGQKDNVDTSGPGPVYTFPYPAGTYTVIAIPDAGYVIAGESEFPGIEIKVPDLPCKLVDHAELPTDASWKHQVCTSTGLTQPTITVAPFPGVNYFLDGKIMTQPTVVTTVGQHRITAEPVDPSNTVTTREWNPLILAAPTAICGDLTTLALTGETPGGWLIVAFVLVQAGFVLLAIRFVRIRRERAARHVAG